MYGHLGQNPVYYTRSRSSETYFFNTVKLHERFSHRLPKTRTELLASKQEGHRIMAATMGDAPLPDPKVRPSTIPQGQEQAAKQPRDLTAVGPRGDAGQDWVEFALCWTICRHWC